MGRKEHAACPRNERKKSERLNGLLAVDVLSAECFFSALAQTNAQTVAEYMADLARHYESLGYVKLRVFLDRNSTHLVKMRTHYESLSAGLGLVLEFVHFPA